MPPKTYVLMGRSGCGKGTQAALLEKALGEKFSHQSVVHLETGKLYREFIKGDTYTHGLSKVIYNSGGLQPQFLTIHLWAGFFIDNMKKDSHMILDGTPRRRDEAAVLHSAFEYYLRETPYIIYLNVSRGWSETRMLERKRTDDTKQDIELRLNWFDTEVVPAIDYYRGNSFYKFIEVSGERSVEEVHADIMEKVGLN